MIQSNTEATSSYSFIRAITKTIVEHCIELNVGAYKLNETLLENLTSVLQRYIQNREILEVQCLYEIQKLIVYLEFPQGKLI